MATLRVTNLKGRTANVAPDLPDGANITGVCTATSFAGDVTGDVTGNITGNVTGNITGNVTGNITGNVTGNVDVADGVHDTNRIAIGAGDDLCLYHNGSNSFVVDRGTGPLYVRGNNAVRIESYVDDTNGEAMIVANTDGAVELYYDNSKKFETGSGGCWVTGNLDASGDIFANSGSISDQNGNVRSLPYTSKSSAHTLVATDAGKVIYISTGGVTLPNAVMSGGDMITIINNSGSDQTLTQDSGLTLYNTADASTGNRTLAGRGMATVWYHGGSLAYISGAGLS